MRAALLKGALRGLPLIHHRPPQEAGEIPARRSSRILPEATERIQRIYHDPPAEFGLQHAQHVVAKDIDFDSWQALVAAKEIEIRLAITMQRIPLLAARGIFPDSLTTEDAKSRFAEQRASLRRHVDDVDWCVGWIRSNIAPIKTINRKRSAYSWKHFAEKYHRHLYITEGIFVAAGIIAGYQYKVTDGPSVHFAMSEKSADILKEREGGWA